ncbi:MAG TPA: alpha/beta fold hydrolase [Polyangia bacterium]|nr:alpha/beta fold hydrolase [Polyangia bacterium]
MSAVRSGDESDRWFRVWNRQPAPRLRLVCLPYAGGQASAFARWADELGSDVEVHALQLPGRGMRLAEPHCTELTRVLDAIMPAVTRLTTAPYALFGHSMGATLAFELSRRLRRADVAPPLRLFVSAARTPRRLRLVDALGPVDDAALVDYLRQLGGTPEEVLREPELLELVLPPLRADLQLLDAWRSPDEPPLDVPLTALGGRADARVSPEELALWRAHTRGPFALQLFDGGHFYLHGERPALLASLRRTLSVDGRSLRRQVQP